MFSAAAAVAVPEMDYASLRTDVVKAYAYAQQAAEMTQSLSVLRLSAQTQLQANSLGERLCLAEEPLQPYIAPACCKYVVAQVVKHEEPACSAVLCWGARVCSSVRVSSRSAGDCAPKNGACSLHGAVTVRRSACACRGAS